MNHQEFLILCVDDEREVLDSVVQDLEEFEEHFVLEAAESVSEAQEVIADYAARDIPLALILCDHIMPEQTGISFLIELNDEKATYPTRKLLLTGQAGLDDTVEAINHACLDFYVSKPWNGDELRSTIRHQLSLYVVSQVKDLKPWVTILEPELLLKKMADSRIDYGE
ncbi:response regulator [Vibrio viridaestus]|uniref:Response regulator n=1 Tax=Vibrio viridaestus TaxID=2487322 RepID=A0A3N9THL8_9VIBR|nr:response regulator [Vibrio viridaestus]RQW63353.1 response regulator [Vibrio viridaestus]